MTRNTLPSTSAYVNLKPAQAPTQTLPGGGPMKEKENHRKPPSNRASDAKASHRGRLNPAFHNEDQEVSNLLNEVIDIGEMTVSNEDLKMKKDINPARQNVYENVQPQHPLERRHVAQSPPKAVVQPMPHSVTSHAEVHRNTSPVKRASSSAARTMPKHYAGEKAESAILAIDDIPKDVVLLSVADVARCLQLLNMRKYVERFERNQVDGAMLVGLNQHSFIGDFHLTPFDANKLHRFARGWRPKVA